MTIYEALNWIKEADYTPCGYIIFNENKPEGQLKGKALKTIFEAAKNDELIPVEVFNQVKKRGIMQPRGLKKKSSYILEMDIPKEELYMIWLIVLLAAMNMKKGIICGESLIVLIADKN